MINLQPSLIGKFFKLRPIVSKDYDALFKAASDPQIWKLHPEPNRYKPEIFKGYFDGAIKSKGGLVVQNLQGDVVGSSRYYDYRLKERDIKIGYTFLTKKYWGGLYNRDMKHLMMTNVYDFVDTIYFLVGQNNLRSQGAMTKIGGQLLSDEQIKEYQPKLVGHVYFSIKKKDFKGLI